MNTCGSFLTQIAFVLLCAGGCRTIEYRINFQNERESGTVFYTAKKGLNGYHCWKNDHPIVPSLVDCRCFKFVREADHLLLRYRMNASLTYSDTLGRLDSTVRFDLKALYEANVGAPMIVGTTHWLKDSLVPIGDRTLRCDVILLERPYQRKKGSRIGYAFINTKSNELVRYVAYDGMDTVRSFDIPQLTMERTSPP